MTTKRVRCRSFRTYGHRLPWNGRMYQLSIHDELWDEAQARETLATGLLPPSKPYVNSKQIRMNEDADIFPGNHTVEWYPSDAVHEGI